MKVQQSNFIHMRLGLQISEFSIQAGEVGGLVGEGLATIPAKAMCHRIVMNLRHRTLISTH